MSEKKKSDLYVKNVQDADKACKLILECMDLNRISKSTGLSAMVTLIASIYMELDSREPFDQMIQSLTSTFDSCWAEKNPNFEKI